MIRFVKRELLFSELVLFCFQKSLKQQRKIQTCSISTCSFFVCRLQGKCREMWTVYANSNVIGGRDTSYANDLSECQSACSNDSDCSGVDYSDSNPIGHRCFIINTVDSTINIGTEAGVTHLSYDRNCTAGK